MSELQISKWKIENGGDISVKRKCFGNCYETWYTEIFGIANCNSDIRFVISDLKNPHTLSFMAIAKNCEFALI